MYLYTHITLIFYILHPNFLTSKDLNFFHIKTLSYLLRPWVLMVIITKSFWNKKKCTMGGGDDCFLHTLLGTRLIANTSRGVGDGRGVAVRIVIALL